MNKLAIVGAEEQTRQNAPFDDLSYDIWTFADWICYDWLKRYSAVIEIHRPKGVSGYTEHPRTPEYWQKLQTIDAPVYMYPPDRRVKSAVEYPLQEVLDLLGTVKEFGKDITPLNCSLAYALGLGFYKGYKQIDVYGVELAVDAYIKQKPIFTFWIGYAAGVGVELNLYCSRGLLTGSLYGIEPESDLNSRLSPYINGMQKELAEIQEREHRLIGALQLISDIQKGGQGVQI